MKEKDFKNMLLTAIKEKESINELIASQNSDDITNNIVKIPTKLIEKKLIDILKSKGIMPLTVKNLNMDFGKDSCILDVCATPAKLIGQLEISFFIKISSIFISKGNIHAVCRVQEHLNKNTAAIKKMALNAFTKNHSILETALKKSNLPENVKFTYENSEFAFFVKISLLKKLSNLELRFAYSDRNFLYFQFNPADEKNIAPKTPKQSNIKTGSISSMLNYSDRF